MKKKSRDTQRKDEVGPTGIYPATGPYPEEDVPVVTPGEFVKESGRLPHEDDEDQIDKKAPR